MSESEIKNFKINFQMVLQQLRQVGNRLKPKLLVLWSQILSKIYKASQQKKMRK